MITTSKAISALTAVSTIGLLTLASILTSSASAQEPYHYQAMAADDFFLWKTGERGGIAFDVWRRSAASGGGYYYFLWEGQYADVEDTGSPEVVVFFEGNIAQLKQAFLTDCYHAPASSNTCLEPDKKPVHYRYDGSCVFPWQPMIGGSLCGNRAAIASPGGF